MHIFGNRQFVEIPGDDLFELPPLFVSNESNPRRSYRMMGMASHVVEEDLVPHIVLDNVATIEQVQSRKMELALNLVDEYLKLVHHWHWGDSIIEWIRQCEITFGSQPHLRPLLQPDVWPHAGRSSFVSLLTDKQIGTKDINLEKAVGLRLTFRQPPPLVCFSDGFLLYLNGTVMPQTYQVWMDLNPAPISALPSERFNFEVITL